MIQSVYTETPIRSLLGLVTMATLTCFQTLFPNSSTRRRNVLIMIPLNTTEKKTQNAPVHMSGQQLAGVLIQNIDNIDYQHQYVNHLGCQMEVELPLIEVAEPLINAIK